MLTVQSLDIDSLSMFPGNPRRGDVSVIVESLRATGQYRPIVVQESTRAILAGNHTWLAAQELGWDSIDAVVLDVDDQTAKRIVLVDNKSADLGTYDQGELLNLLRSLDDLTGTGYVTDDIDHLAEVLDELPPLKSNDDPDAFDETLLWPVVRVRVRPDLYDGFKDLPGKDDAEKFTLLLEATCSG